MLDTYISYLHFVLRLHGAFEKVRWMHRREAAIFVLPWHLYCSDCCWNRYSYSYCFYYCFCCYFWRWSRGWHRIRRIHNRYVPVIGASEDFSEIFRPVRYRSWKEEKSYWFYWLFYTSGIAPTTLWLITGSRCSCLRNLSSAWTKFIWTILWLNLTC